ncbi:MAG: Ada metal-binding domain-containing protein [Elusimicrobiales bacterium]|nr:Ada metal-binding domain-containing protein [Elusimicrobiales bacterium]
MGSALKGRYTAVKTTGIYCRSGCPARAPLARNVCFFKTVREAQAAGFRACKRCNPGTEDVFETKLRLPPDFDFSWLLEFFKARAVSGIEEVLGRVYKRSLRYQGLPVMLELKTNGRFLEARVAGNIDKNGANRLLTRLFDCDADIAVFRTAVRADPLLKKLVARRPGIRLPVYADSFEGVIRAILGQQVSLAAARTMAGRLVSRFGAHAPAIDGSAFRLFPAAAVLAVASAEELRKIGLTNAKVKTISVISGAIAGGSLNLEELQTATAETAQQTLRGFPGIGPWTASYIRMRVLGDRDAFPASDLGVLKALNETDVNAIEKRSLAWKPWRAYATLHLWNSLAE